MKKMLYCMHVGWNWIKQRPHFIAEELASEYELTVVSNYTYRQNKKNSIRKPINFKVKEFYKIPVIDHFKYLRAINDLWKKLYFRRAIRKITPDYIYVMSPNAAKFIPKQPKQKVIYDCMDDMIEFESDAKQKKYIYDNEKNVIEKADIVIASSDRLMQCLCKRYGIMNTKMKTVVRNGFNGQIIEQKPLLSGTNQYRLCYFGTFAEWFNFDFVLKSLQDVPNLQYVFIGPLQHGCNMPSHEGITYLGTVKHDELFEYVRNVDAFVMPFKVTDLIQSVDPVKLYEYLNFNKNILSVEYPEIRRFSNFVYFYNTYDEYINQIRAMKESQDLKYTSEQRKNFLEENTWKQRGKQIVEIIDKMEKNSKR